MELNAESYQRGYDAAYGELYRSANSNNHHAECGSCRACGVVAEVAENLVEQLASWMTETELDAFADTVIRIGKRRELALRAGEELGTGGWASFQIKEQSQ